MALAPWVQPVAYCETDRYCQALLLSRMAEGRLPYAPIWPDVRTLSAGLLERVPVDIVYGGFPCQDISIAGDGVGLEGERSKLFYEVARLVREIRPSFVFLENVAAIAFRGLDRVAAEMAALGYDCRWDMLRASDVGAPHRRERWWLLAHSHGAGLPEPWPLRPETQARLASHRAATERGFQREIWLPATGELCRVADGISPATHRIRALGNAVVPQCAREAFKRLIGMIPA